MFDIAISQKKKESDGIYCVLRHSQNEWYVNLLCTLAVLRLNAHAVSAYLI